MSKNIITLDGISKHYRIYSKPIDRLKQMILRKTYGREHVALKPVDLEINKGQTVGIVGGNGSGKSTILQIICGVLQPSSGKMVVDGRISALLELGAGFNPEFTGRENIHLNAAVLGLSKQEIAEKYDSIVEFSGLDENAINQPVKTYSSGMYVRLAFAIAVATEPDILVVDEALAVGDEAFQRKCFARIRDMQAKGATILFVSHSAKMITELCDHAIWLQDGELITQGEPKAITSAYQKYSYAPRTKRPELIEFYKKEGVEGEDEPDIKMDFDPSMKPESLVSYEKNGAEIIDPKLLDSSGDSVNILNHGEHYKFAYKVKFEKTATDLRFGMLIKTMQGVELGGASRTAEMLDLPMDIEAGKEINLEFEFKASMLEGAYFFNCGCSGIMDGQRVFLHRIHDVLMFKLVETGTKKANGLVSFEPKVKANISS